MRTTTALAFVDELEKLVRERVSSQGETYLFRLKRRQAPRRVPPVFENVLENRDSPFVILDDQDLKGSMVSHQCSYCTFLVVDFT